LAAVLGRVRSAEEHRPADVERKRAGAEAAWAAAKEALAQVRSLLVAGKTADAQRAALTMATLTDKSGVLEEAARREEERLVTRMR
jgi:hypothetical protein